MSVVAVSEDRRKVHLIINNVKVKEQMAFICSRILGSNLTYIFDLLCLISHQNKPMIRDQTTFSLEHFSNGAIENVIVLPINAARSKELLKV